MRVMTRLKTWLDQIVSAPIKYKKMPIRNDTSDYADLPKHVSDILYLDKPDIIFTMMDGGHEKPLLSIEFASCTPQYQHALQRFSRMVASISTRCPSVIIIPKKKRENTGGHRVYSRSPAIEYGAVRLMDIYRTPCFVLDWPSDKNHFLQMEDETSYPPIVSASMLDLKTLITACIKARSDVNYSESLCKSQIVRTLTDKNRVNAYKGGVPTISNPSGGNKKSSGKTGFKRNTSVNSRN